MLGDSDDSRTLEAQPNTAPGKLFDDYVNTVQ